MTCFCAASTSLRRTRPRSLISSRRPSAARVDIAAKNRSRSSSGMPFSASISSVLSTSRSSAPIIWPSST
jgi:hypothetical protein